MTRYDEERRGRYLAAKARLTLWNAAALAVADPSPANIESLRSVVAAQAAKAEDDRSAVTYHEGYEARTAELLEASAAKAQSLLASVTEPLGDRCQVEASDHDSRWPRYHQCPRAARGRIVTGDHGPMDACSQHIAMWTKGRSVWPHKDKG